MKIKWKNGLAWVLTICMALTLLPVSALAANLPAPSGLTLGIGSSNENDGEFGKTYPVLSWTNDNTSYKYKLYQQGQTSSFEDGSGSGAYQAAKLSGWMTMDDASIPSRTYNKVDFAFKDGGTTGPWASLDINLTFNQVESSIPYTVVPIENPYPQPGDTESYFKIQGLPAETSVEFWYVPDAGPTQGLSSNSDNNGNFLFSDYLSEIIWHYSLGDEEIAAGDKYFVDVCQTVQNGNALTCTITRHPLTIVFDQRAEQNLSFDTANAVTKTYGDNAFTNDATNNTQGGGGTITYSSGNTNVATVNANTGEVTIAGAGTTTITATAAETGTSSSDFRSTSISYNLTVNKKAVSASYGGTAITKPYDGTAAVKANGQTVTQLDFNVDPSDLVGSDALTVKLNNPVFASADVGTGIGITGTLSVTGSGNYQVTPSITGTITKAAPTADDFQVTLPSALYVGDSVAPAITPKTGLTSMGAVTVKYNNSTTAPTAAGTYAVTFDVAGGTNYAAVTGLSAGSLTIYNKMTVAAAATTNSANDTTLVNTGRYTVSPPAAVMGKANAYTVAIQGNTALQSYASADPDQGTGTWIGLLLTTNKNSAVQNANSLYWSADGSTWASLNGEAALSADDGGDGTNAFVFWMNTTANTAVTRYIATDSNGSDKLELTFSFTAYTPHYTGGTGGDTSTATTTPTTSGGMSTTTVTPTVNNGTASAAVTSAQVTEAIKAAQTAAVKSGEKPRVEIAVSAASGTNAATVTLPQSSIQSLATGAIDALTVSSSVASVSFDARAINTIAGAASGDVTVSAARVENSTLSAAAAQVVGDHPIYNFSVTNGGSTISQFGGAVTVSVPYTLAAGEDPNAVVAYYINANGEPELMQNCHYEADTGTLLFTTTHFSTYALGYNKVTFNDVSGTAWYADAVAFLAARDITSGTTETTFSPDQTLTRGQFITLLLRAYAIEPDENAADNFSDAGNTYYTSYLAAAKSLGITTGIGDNRFKPDEEISRQDMFTMLYRALVTMGELPAAAKDTSLSDFSDASAISDYAATAIKAFVSSGIVSGSNGELNPLDGSTRAQMAQILFSLLSK